jgi:hypothetical protein
VETHLLWADVEMGYRWAHRAAHLLTNHEKQNALQIRQRYETLLSEMEQTPKTTETLATMFTTFGKVTASSWPGLFHCYDEPNLPRTNNDLEQYFGSARRHERRATGRKSASPGLVVRGAVRVIALVASPRHHFNVAELRLTDISRWRALRSELEYRHETRRHHYRFRKSPQEYLAVLEEKFLQQRLPS